MSKADIGATADQPERRGTYTLIKVTDLAALQAELAGCRACRSKIDCISRNEKANDYSDRVRELERVLEVEIKLLGERHPKKFLEASLGYEALLWKRLTAALRKDAP